MIAFIIAYTISKKAVILQALSKLSTELLLASALLIFLAKLGLAVNMRQAAERFAIELGWVECYRIYNLTQLGKYIPGSIWQFVGRIAILRERDVSAKAIRDSLLAEHFWILGSAGFMAIVLIFATRPDFFGFLLVGYGTGPQRAWLLIGLGVAFIALVFGFRLNRRFSDWLLRLLPPLRAIPVLILVWFFMGAALWVTLAPFVEQGPSLFYVVGTYCFAFLLGFVVPFAPAGLGIREAMIVLALLPYLPTETAILLAAINRIVNFGVEIFAASLCVPRKKINGRSWW